MGRGYLVAVNWVNVRSPTSNMDPKWCIIHCFNCYAAENDTLKLHFEYMLLTFCYLLPLKCDGS